MLVRLRPSYPELFARPLGHEALLELSRMRAVSHVLAILMHARGGGGTTAAPSQSQCDRPRTHQSKTTHLLAVPLWRHRTDPAEAPIRLTDARYTADGVLTHPGPRTLLGEDVLARHLQDARALLATRPDDVPAEPTGLPADFETLRWFHLPRICLTP